MKHGMIVMLGGVVKALAVAATISFAFSAQAATKKIGNNIWTYKVIKGGVQIGDGANVAVSPAHGDDPVLEAVAIPHSLTNFEANAFAATPKWKEVRYEVEGDDASGRACRGRSKVLPPLSFVVCPLSSPPLRTEDKGRKTKALGPWTLGERLAPPRTTNQPPPGHGC